MKYLSIAAFSLLLIPHLAVADILTPPEENPPAWEEAAQLALTIDANGTLLTDATLVSGVPHAFSYEIGYKNTWFYDPNNEFTDAYREEQFATTLDRYKTYLTLWRGAPLTPGAELLDSWEITGARTGTITATLPETGDYFFAVDLPNYLYRDPEGECSRVGDPIEICLPESTLPLSLEASWAYLTDAWAQAEDSDGGIYTTMGFGAVLFSVEADEPASGISNILFLPGLQGSRLYQQVLGIENRRWELSLSTSQLDAEALYLNEDGNSVNPVYTKSDGVIRKTNIGIPRADFDLYRTFLEKLQRLKNDGLLTDYRAFAYDWRANPIDVVEEGTPYADGTRFVSDELEELARTSLTGKVTIIGHSNGGLVAKALMRRLEREGKAELVDRVVFADVPQLGTPQAIAPMLHGDYGSLTSFGGLYLSKPNARRLAERMPDGFALLPSREYFERVDDPVIDLTAAPELQQVAGVSATVSTQEDFRKFMTNALRPKPDVTDIETPGVLLLHLFAEGEALHEHLDGWEAPIGVAVIQIAGWGLDTAKGIKYEESKEKECAFIVFACREITKLTHQALMSEDGDGTVLGVSEAPNEWETYIIDLPKANRELQKNWRHADITETTPFQELFDYLIGSSTAGLPAYVSTAIPEQTGKRLRLRVLSPVTLSVFDAEGRHTGSAEIPGASSDLLYKEEQIPNSYYEEFGEGKYVGVPAMPETTVQMQGLDTGTFTVEVALIDGGTVIKTVRYPELPVTPHAQAALAIKGAAIDEAELTLDVNGDGAVDIHAAPAASVSPIAYLSTMRSGILSLGLATSTVRQLAAKLSNLESILLKKEAWNTLDDDNDWKPLKKREKLQTHALRKLGKIENWVERQLVKKEQGKKGLTPAEAEMLLAQLGYLRSLIN